MAPLRMTVTSQIRDIKSGKWKNPPVWEYIHDSFEVPVNEWMKINVHFKEGDIENGRLMIAVTIDNDSTILVHDINNYTHHPEDPNPDGLSHFNPFKLYTSNNVIDHVRTSGKLLNVYWDDFEMSINN